MTRAEFDTWVEQHYQDLVNVAVAVVGPRDAADAVHDMAAGWLTSGKYARCDREKNAVAWATLDVRCYARNRRRGRERAVANADDVSYLNGPISGERTAPAPRAE